MPTKNNADTLINMIIFQPKKTRVCYSKQYLHSDEYPYFSKGSSQTYMTINKKKIAPAICYESMLIEHVEHAFNNGAEIYVASVAKSTEDVKKAMKYYPKIANKFSIPVLMVNCVGFCDNFESVGTTSIWNNKETLIGQLNNKSEGILIFNTDTQKVAKLLL